MENFEIVKFENGEFSLDVKAEYEKETVWLSKEQISLLYKRDRSVISRHIRNIYNENELDRNSSCAKNAHEVNNQIHYTDLYNLDVVISVGYRVKSSNGIMFRKWANSVLKEYLIKGVTINEKRLIALNKTIDIQNKMLSSTLHIDEFELSNVINEYTSALDLLDDYDHNRVEQPKGHPSTYVLTYDECRRVIDQMKFGNESDFLVLRKKLGNLTVFWLLFIKTSLEKRYIKQLKIKQRICFIS